MNLYQNPLKFPEQDPERGVGDPFVFRHNGRYYMCPSPSGIDNGILLWESEDMTNWTYLGNVAPDERLTNTYAPEMFYFNGTFYLMGSPKGEGHYLFTSDSPKGPFKQLTDNLGLVIDGSLFADDDGALIFTHAEYPSIHAHRMERNGAMGEAAELFGTSMGHWTEGPGIFKRGDKYYITMTGNHLISRGYRIDYAISDSGPMGPYRVPRNKTLLVNTIYEYGSLGHSSNVIGPDLDSYWIFYHSFLIQKDGDKRGSRRRGRFTHMDRMVFHGDELHVSGPSLTACPAPAPPDFFGWADEAATADRFLRDEDSVLSLREMGAHGTAEVCLIPGKAGAAVFAYRDTDNYVSAALSGGGLKVSRLQDGREEALLERPLFEGFRGDVLHTLRVEGSSDSTLFLVDHMQQGGIPAMDLTGRIGTKGADRTSFAAFSGHVRQSGDSLHYHYVPGFLGSLTAMGKTGETLTTDEGERRLVLKAGESVNYRVNVSAAGTYRIQAAMQAFIASGVTCAFEGGAFSGKLERMDTLKRVELGTVELLAGLQEWSFTMTEGEAQLRGFDLFPAADKEASEYEGLSLCRSTLQIEGEVCIDRAEGLQMDRPGQVLCQFGGRFHTDGFIETDMVFRGDDLRLSAGLFLRVSENSAYHDQAEIGHRGYYIGFNTNDVFIWRMNFDKTVLVKRRCRLNVGKTHCIRAEIRGNTISAYVDGLPVATAADSDSLPFGKAAVGSFGARVTFTRVKYGLD
jgi:hypothetical protein